MAAVFQSSDPRARSHTTRAEKVFLSSSSHSCSWEHNDYTPLSLLSLSISSPTFFVLSGTLFQVCWCTNSQCALSFAPHIHTFSSTLSHYQLCSFSSLPRIQQVHTSLNCVPDLSLHIFSFFFYTTPSLAKNYFSFFLSFHHHYHYNNHVIILSRQL